jgi:hypothetical protein
VLPDDSALKTVAVELDELDDVEVVVVLVLVLDEDDEEEDETGR